MCVVIYVGRHRIVWQEMNWGNIMRTDFKLDSLVVNG